jgi:endonuclease/exonuclease/phosphatase (EEP) superfamily protein YafD
MSPAERAPTHPDPTTAEATATGVWFNARYKTQHGNGQPALEDLDVLLAEAPTWICMQEVLTDSTGTTTYDTALAGRDYQTFFMPLRPEKGSGNLIAVHESATVISEPQQVQLTGHERDLLQLITLKIRDVLLDVGNMHVLSRMPRLGVRQRRRESLATLGRLLQDPERTHSLIIGGDGNHGTSTRSQRTLAERVHLRTGEPHIKTWRIGPFSMDLDFVAENPHGTQTAHLTNVSVLPTPHSDHHALLARITTNPT